jgi:hypothetical protein
MAANLLSREPNEDELNEPTDGHELADLSLTSDQADFQLILRFQERSPCVVQKAGKVAWRKSSESFGEIALSGVGCVPDVVAKSEIAACRQLRGQFEDPKAQFAGQLLCLEILIASHTRCTAGDVPTKSPVWKGRAIRTQFLQRFIRLSRRNYTTDGQCRTHELTNLRTYEPTNLRTYPSPWPVFRTYPPPKPNVPLSSIGDGTKHVSAFTFRKSQRRRGARCGDFL